MYGTNAESCQYPLWHVARADHGVSQIFRLLFLGNGWADCVKILYLIGVPLVPQLMQQSRVGYLCAHVQRYPHTALLLLGNDSNAVQTGSIFSFLSAIGFRAVYSPQ